MAEAKGKKGIQPGICLCLSGGGYRAMLFHVGVVWRLHELGMLPRLDRISSVSGGSITSGALAKCWADVVHADLDALKEKFVRPIREFAARTIDVPSILEGFVPGISVGDRVAARYRQHLFGGMTLKDLPDEPRFVFNTVSLQSAVLFRFQKPYMWDYRVGKIEKPEVPLATVVAASSAFPPFLSPIILKANSADFVPKTGMDLQRTPYTERIVLADGGVYDNLGLETGWDRYRTLLVSDAGGKTQPQKRPSAVWPMQFLRVMTIVDNQAAA